MAYADGELDDPARTEVERAMRSDPALAERVAQHQAMRADVFAAFAPIADEPVPPALLAAAMPDKVSDLGAVRAARTESRRRWAWQEWSAIAASLSVGVLVGSLALGGGGGGGNGNGNSNGADLAVAHGPGGVPIAQGRLADALSNQLAGAPEAGAIRIGISFAATDGALCRSFIAGASAGLALSSTPELSVRTDDGQVGKVQACVVVGPVGDFQPAQVELAQALQRHLHFLARRLGACPLESFYQHLGRCKAFEHGGADVAQALGTCQLLRLLHHGVGHRALVGVDLGHDHAPRIGPQAFDEARRGIVRQRHDLRGRARSGAVSMRLVHQQYQV
eukprot:gene37850-46706_t